MNNRESFSRPQLSQKLMTEGLDEYYNSPEQTQRLEKEDQDKKDIRKERLKLERENHNKKEEQRNLFLEMSKGISVKSPKDVLLFPSELRSMAMELYLNNTSERFKKLAEFRDFAFNYIDTHFERSDFSKEHLSEVLLQKGSEYGFLTEELSYINDRIAVFWDNYQNILKYQSKTKNEVISDFTWKYGNTFEKLDIENINVEYTPYAIIFNFSKVDITGKYKHEVWETERVLRRNFNTFSIGAFDPKDKYYSYAAGYSILKNGIEIIAICDISNYESTFKHELQHAKDSIFGIESGRPDNIKISLNRAKLEIFAFLIEGKSPVQILEIFKDFYKDLYNLLPPKDQEIYLKTLSSSISVIRSMWRSGLSAEKIIGMFSDSSLDNWEKEYKRFIKYRV